nr:leucine-rich repeat extensin-like protein 5 [Ipomoea batatas]
MHLVYDFDKSDIKRNGKQHSSREAAKNIDRGSLMLNVWVKENSDKLEVEYSAEKLRKLYRLSNGNMPSGHGPEDFYHICQVRRVMFSVTLINYASTTNEYGSPPPLSLSPQLPNMALNFLFPLLLFSVTTTAQDCPYPCFPPPSGPGNNPPATTTPPSPPSQTASNPPATTLTPPAVGGYNNPYNNPPPDFMNSIAPPPPDPILPWFPYYYRKSPHADADQQSSSASSFPAGSPSSTTMKMIITTTVPITLFLIFTFVFQ